MGGQPGGPLGGPLQAPGAMNAPARIFERPATRGRAVRLPSYVGGPASLCPAAELRRARPPGSQSLWAVCALSPRAAAESAGAQERNHRHPRGTAGSAAPRPLRERPPRCTSAQHSARAARLSEETEEFLTSSADFDSTGRVSFSDTHLSRFHGFLVPHT